MIFIFADSSYSQIPRPGQVHIRINQFYESLRVPRLQVANSANGRELQLVYLLIQAVYSTR